MGSPGEVTGPVNIGNPDEFTMLELAKKVLAMTGSTSAALLRATRAFSGRTESAAMSWMSP